MDHPHYRYSALPLRPASALAPGLHVYVVLYLEHWDAEPPAEHLRDPRFVGEFGSFTPDYRSWTQREYGLRIGVFRLIEALAPRGIRPSVAANALVLDRVPEALAALQALQPCWIGHGLQATELMHSGQTRAAQAEHITSALKALRHTGAQVAGWLSQDWGTTPDTQALLADAGLSYTLDWVNDDQPYWMEAAGVSGRRLLALPLSSEWDDVQTQWMRHIEPADHAGLILEAARTLAHECQTHERAAVMGLGLHPWVWGMPSRFKHLGALLDGLAAIGGVHWHTSDALFDQCALSRPTETP